VPYQGLEAMLSGGAHDLDLGIAATGRAARVIGGAAGSRGAGVRAGVNGKLSGQSWKRWQHPGYHPTGLDDPESISRKGPRLGRIGYGVPGPPTEAVGPTAIARAVPLEMPAGHLEIRLVEEVLAAPLQVAEESDAAGVAKQERRFMVGRLGIAVPGSFPGSHPKQDPKPVALRAHGTAGWCGEPAGSAHLESIRSGGEITSLTIFDPSFRWWAHLFRLGGSTE
jgi:hypothetical protein